MTYESLLLRQIQGPEIPEVNSEPRQLVATVTAELSLGHTEYSKLTPSGQKQTCSGPCIHTFH